MILVQQFESHCWELGHSLTVIATSGSSAESLKVKLEAISSLVSGADPMNVSTFRLVRGNEANANLRMVARLSCHIFTRRSFDIAESHCMAWRKRRS